MPEPTDYQGNAKKDRLKAVPEKKVEKVVAGEVIVQKKSIARKFKDLFVEADFRTVVRYVASDVLLPAFRNMIVDASTKGVERMMYGDSVIRRRNYGQMYGGPRITYNNPLSRDPRTAPPRPGLLSQRSSARHIKEDFVLSSREEAEMVLERMNDIIDTYEVASVGDLNELVGLPSNHTDQKWGWIYLRDVQVKQIREGYVIDLPPAEPIQ